MDLKEIHEQVDEKLIKIDAEIERFKNDIAGCEEPEQRQILEKDLATLHVIREKLLKAKGLSQQVTDLKQHVENPDSFDQGDTVLGVPKTIGIGLLSAMGILIVGWLMWVV